MPHRHGLVAWIEPKVGRCSAAFVSGATDGLRAPATRHFGSVREARGWVEQEAAALGGVPIAWVDRPDGASQQRHAGRGDVLAAELFNAP
jgi:hypothetical protein